MSSVKVNVMAQKVMLFLYVFSIIQCVLVVFSKPFYLFFLFQFLSKIHSLFFVFFVFDISSPSRASLLVDRESTRPFTVKTRTNIQSPIVLMAGKLKYSNGYGMNDDRPLGNTWSFCIFDTGCTLCKFVWSLLVLAA